LQLTEHGDNKALEVEDTRSFTDKIILFC